MFYINVRAYFNSVIQNTYLFCCNSNRPLPNKHNIVQCQTSVAQSTIYRVLYSEIFDFPPPGIEGHISVKLCQGLRRILLGAAALFHLNQGV